MIGRVGADEFGRKLIRDLSLSELETSISGVVRAAQIARDLGAVFILDPAPARALPPELLALTDWITPNEQEAKSLLGWTSGPFDPFDAVRALQAWGPRNVILKMSSKGAILLTRDGGPMHIPEMPVSAVDSTAAGDTFNGAFAVALAEGREPALAVEFAGTAAALSVTKRGAQASMPVRADIDAMVAGALRR